MGDQKFPFDFTEGFWKDSLLMVDRETSSIWSQFEGKTIGGPLEGRPLTVVPSMQTTWRRWRERNSEQRRQRDEGHAMTSLPGARVALTAFAVVFLSAGTARGADPQNPVKRAPTTLEAKRTTLGYGKQEIGLTVGYGQGLPIPAGRSDLRNLEFVSANPRWGIGINGPLGRETWYRGYFEALVEGAFLVNFEPMDGFAAGLSFLLRYNFLRDSRFVPFVEIGAGAVYLDFDLESHADGFNFTPQGGFGVHYFLSERAAVTSEWRFHHISNAGLRPPNRGINDSLFLLGATFFLD